MSRLQLYKPRSEKVSLTEDLTQKLLTVLELVLEKGSIKKKCDPFSQLSWEFLSKRKCNAMCNMGYDFVKLLNECLTSHRYREAVDLLWIASLDLDIDERYIFKVILIVLNNLQISKEKVAEKLFQVFKGIIRFKFTRLNKRELVLEYIVQSIVHQCKDLEEKISNLYTKKKRPIYGLEKTYQLFVWLLEGYLAYLNCQQYCEGKNKDGQALLDQALMKMHSLIKNPGSWDIFVLKLVEALKKFNRNEDIRKLLSDYAECQPRNLNAQIYICEYLEENDPDSEQLVKHLKEIAKLEPSDERVLLLLKRCQKIDLTYSESLNTIFMFLDYPSNGGSIRAWKILRKLLKQGNKSGDKSSLKCIKTHWKSRRKSWIWLHFNHMQLSNLNIDDALVTIKVKVLQLLDEDHEYIKGVYEKFPHLFS